METIKDFFDVEKAVADDVAKLNASHGILTQLQQQEASRATKRAEELAVVKKEIAELRESNKISCRPALERADELSLAGIFFKQISDAIRDSYSYVQNLMQRETEQYGYVSKNVLSLTLSLEALRTAMQSGKPFHHELSAFKENVGDIDQELAVWADVLQHFAFKGLPQKPDVHAAAVRLAHTIKDVEVFRASDKEQPRSFLDFLKFSSSRFIPAYRPEVYADYANIILDATRADDWESATRNADAAAKLFGLEKLAKNPLDPSQWGLQHGKRPLVRVQPAAAYYHFKECVSGLVVAQQFHQYCQAALTMQQYRMTEAFVH